LVLLRQGKRTADSAPALNKGDIAVFAISQYYLVFKTAKAAI
jgi:hypothetical protein